MLKACNHVVSNPHHELCSGAVQWLRLALIASRSSNDFCVLALLQIMTIRVRVRHFSSNFGDGYDVTLQLSNTLICGCFFISVTLQSDRWRQTLPEAAIGKCCREYGE
jgi:hypothetical protein